MLNIIRSLLFAGLAFLRTRGQLAVEILALRLSLPKTHPSENHARAPRVFDLALRIRPRRPGLTPDALLGVELTRYSAKSNIVTTSPRWSSRSPHRGWPPQAHSQRQDAGV